MILYPIGGDQYFNAIRTQQLECGLIIKDRENMNDLIQNINILLINKKSSNYYQNNIKQIHKMLKAYGGVSKATDFIEYAAEFGIQHLLCTLGHKYKCDESKIPWYQQTIIDGYYFKEMLF